MELREALEEIVDKTAHLLTLSHELKLSFALKDTLHVKQVVTRIKSTLGELEELMKVVEDGLPKDA